MFLRIARLVIIVLLMAAMESAAVAKISSTADPTIGPEIGKATLGRSLSVKYFGAVGDGMTDDYAAIQKALDYIGKVGRGTLSFPKGNYLCSKTLFCSSNTNLVGMGIGVSRITFITNNSLDNVRLELATNTSLRSMTVSESGVTGRVGCYGPVTVGSKQAQSDVVIENIEVDSSSGLGVEIIRGTRVKVNNCYIHNTQADGIHVTWGSRDITITNNTVLDTGDDSIGIISEALATLGHVSNCIVANNLLGDHKPSSLQGSGISMAGAVNITVRDNVIRNVSGAGINVNGWSEDGTSLVSGNIEVYDNSVTNAGINPKAGNRNGAAIICCRNVTLKNNTFTNSARNGMYLGGALVDIYVEGNTVNGTGGQGMYIHPIYYDKGGVLSIWTDSNFTVDEVKDYAYGHNISVLRNTIIAPYLSGIWAHGETGHYIEGLTVEGNQLYNVNTSNTVGQTVIFVQFIENPVLRSNVLYDQTQSLTLGDFVVSLCTGISQIEENIY